MTALPALRIDCQHYFCYRPTLPWGRPVYMGLIKMARGLIYALITGLLTYGCAPNSPIGFRETYPEPSPGWERKSSVVVHPQSRSVGEFSPIR